MGSQVRYAQTNTHTTAVVGVKKGAEFLSGIE
jgi:hypothetical protein